MVCSLDRCCSLLVVLAVLTVTAATHADTITTDPVIGIRRHSPSAMALKGARLVVSPTETIDNGTVLVRDGNIVGVGVDLEVPAGFRPIEMSGQTIYAGLIDAYGEWELSDDKQPRAHWSENVRPERDVKDYFAPNKNRNTKLRSQGITARLIAPTGGQVKGVSALVLTGDGKARENMLRPATALHISLTARRSRDTYPGSPMGAVALVRQTFYDAAWYGDAWAAYLRNTELPQPARNAALDRMHRWIDSGSPIIVDASNERFFLRADRLAREFDIEVLVRGSGREYRRLAAVAETGRPVLVPVRFPKAPNVSTVDAARRTSLERLLHWDHAPENLARLEAAQVRFAITTDRLDDPSKFLSQVRLAVRRGLSPAGALAALTTTPAELLGIDDHVGTISVGKLANLVITDGDLFGHDKKATVLETWVRGKRYLVQPKPPADARGTWRIRPVETQLETTRLLLKLTGAPGKLKGQWHAGDEEIDVQRIELRDSLLNFAVPLEKLGKEGVAHFTFTLSPDALAERAALGEVVWPNGQRSVCRARRIAKYEDSDREDSGDTTQKNKNGEEPGAEEKGDDPDEKKSPADVAKRAFPALFELHYPLGAYGREQLPRPQTVLFRGATVWTSGPDGRLEHASVLIRDGKIAAVGTDIDAPESATVIELDGKHLTPGIIDCHSHIATDGGVNESTQAITAEVRIGDFIDPDHIAIYRQLAGGVTSANILHGSANPIGGQNQVIKMRWGSTPEELKFTQAPRGIKFALGENVKHSNRGERYTTRYPQTRMGVDALIRDAFQRAKEYAAQRQRWDADQQGLPPRRDLELDAIAEILAGERWIHCHSYRQSEILALLKTCDEFGVTIGTLQHILEGYKLANEMADRGVMGSSFSDWWAYKFEVYDAIPYNGALMHRAGVVVSFNSDDAELGRRLNCEAAKAVKYGGVPAEEALQFVTLNPARQLRVDRYVGSIEVGKDADLVVWSGPPLSVYSRCEQTWIDGARYFDLDEDRELRDRDAKRHAALVQRILTDGHDMLKPGEREVNSWELWARYDEFCGHHHDERDGHHEYEND